MMADPHKVLPGEPGIVPAPFGELRVLLACLAATLPFAWLLSRAIVVSKNIALLILPIALVLAAWPVWYPPGRLYFGDGQSALESFLTMHAWRINIVLLAQMPLLLAVRGLIGAAATKTDFLTATIWLLVAIVPTGCYCFRRAETLGEEASAYVDQSRLPIQRQPRLAWQRLAAARAIRGFQDDQTRILHARLDQHLAGLFRSAFQAAEPTGEAALPVVGAYLQLDLNQDARALLGRIASSSREKLEMEIVLALRERRWVDIERLVGELLRRHPEQDNTLAHDGLATALASQGKRREAEQVYLDRLAADSNPRAQVHWHFRLATAYNDGGRPRLAQEHATAALAIAEQDPELRKSAEYKSIQSFVRMLATQTPACLFASRESKPLGK
jgi:tetratricopeptide (TPR) repeat protein